MLRGWLFIAALLASPCVIFVMCFRSAREGGWRRLALVLCAMAATAFLTWLVCDFRLWAWQSNQGLHNRLNVCMLHDDLTALIDIGDETLAREYVGFFGTNGCTLLNYEMMQTERGRELRERRLDWSMRIKELKDKAKRK